jgi:hypothetical protein
MAAQPVPTPLGAKMRVSTTGNSYLLHLNICAIKQAEHHVYLCITLAFATQST